MLQDSERKFARRVLSFATRSVLVGAGLLVLSAVAMGQPAVSVGLPGEAGEWSVQEQNVGGFPTEEITVSIAGVGTFHVAPTDLQQARPDLFQPGRFSVFDVIARLGEGGDIDLVSHYDEEAATHVVDSINGSDRWWYEAHYDSGWFERNAFRIDHYPVKNGTTIRLSRISSRQWNGIHDEFREETSRLAANGGSVIVPSVVTQGPRRQSLKFENVAVTAHGVRSDIFRSGVITALDIILSLGEQGALDEVGLTWYDQIGAADPVDHYFIERIVAGELRFQASGGCGFVYEVGSTAFDGFAGSHIHIPTDARIIVSPEYALWFWLCL